jgi:hypothetical protein
LGIPRAPGGRTHGPTCQASPRSRVGRLRAVPRWATRGPSPDLSPHQVRLQKCMISRAGPRGPGGGPPGPSPVPRMHSCYPPSRITFAWRAEEVDVPASKSARLA